MYAQSPYRKTKTLEGPARTHGNVKVQCWESFVAHEVFTVMLCNLPVLSAVAYPDTGQILSEYFENVHMTADSF